MARMIDADALSEAMYRKSFETDDGRQRWDGGLWIRYKVFEEARDEAPTIYRVPTPRDCPFCGGPADCPFCGGPAEVHQLHKDEWYVACGNSDCPVNPETSCFDTETDAIEAWNNSYNTPKVTCDWR